MHLYICVCVCLTLYFNKLLYHILLECPIYRTYVYIYIYIYIYIYYS